MVLRTATSLLGALEGVGPENLDFFGLKRHSLHSCHFKSQFSGPTLSNAPRNDVARLKTITYRAIKTTGTLIVSMARQTDKKENKIFLIYVYKEIQMGAVAKSYMRKGFLIYEEMRKYLVIYEKAVSHILLCNRSLLDFLVYE